MTEDKDQSVDPKKLTMKQMAQLIDDRFIGGCRMMEGAFAGQTWMLVEADQLDGLKQIVATLEYLAPHQATIKRAIQGEY